MKTKRVVTTNARKLYHCPKNNVKKHIVMSICAALLLFSCSKDSDMEVFETESLNANVNHSKKQSPDMVLTWNQAMQDLYTFPFPNSGPPVSVSYTWALVHLAIHDALNSITPRYETYVGVPRDAKANPDAAVAQAAYDVIMSIKNFPFSAAYVPQNIGTIHSLLESSLATIPDGEDKDRGIALGHAVAQAIMASRSGDLISLAPASPNQPLAGTQPGEYRYLPFAPAPNGMGHAFPNYGNLRPFFMESNTQFRPGPPYSISSLEYATDYNEVKDFGRVDSAIRTSDQTELGKFWAENTSRGWNEIARNVLHSYPYQSQNAWKTAKYLALVHSAIADAYISVFESKIYYYTWRPIHAIRLADTDGNDNTMADPNWIPLMNTPAIGEYPSAHALTGAAAGQVIYRFFDNRDNYSINQNSGFLPGVTRTFSSISEAIRENSISRIFIGYHFRQAVEVGEAMGTDLGDFVYENALKEINGT